jgi:type 1 glutamine amidotransferase
MKSVFFLALGAVAFLGLCPAGISAPVPVPPGKTRVLIVTGGHEFETPQFFKMFEANPDITFKAAEHPNAHVLLKAEAAKDWDVLLLYDMHQEITDEAKADFLARLHEGKGLVVLHHAIANYQAWGEYHQIIGARYYLAETNINGIKKLRSAWKHDMKIPIQIATPEHPVTQGLKDYVTHDETYKWFDVFEGSQPLLRTEEPESNPVIAWAKTYDKSRVVYIQSGHDHQAYEDPNFQKLVRQAINWVAHKN